MSDTPPSDREQMLVRLGMPAVERAAKSVASRSAGRVKWRELLAVGTFALYHVARTYKDEHAHEFGDHAFRRVRDAMLAVVHAEVFQERVRRAGMRAADRAAAYYRDDEFDVLRHDEDDARRHLRSFLEEVLVATFIGAVDGARTAATSDPAAAEEYRRAIEALGASLRRLSDEQFKLVVLVYREEIDLDEVGAMLGLTYSTVKRRHAEALATLRGDLVTSGVQRAPPLQETPVDDVL